MTGDEARAELDKLLGDFGAAVGMAGLQTEENGVCVLVFEGRTRVNLVADPNTRHLVVWSPLGRVQPDRAEPMLRTLMQANLFWNGTQGATLEIMPEEDDIVISIRRPLDGIDDEALRELIELIVERAEHFAPIVAGEQTAVVHGSEFPIAASAIRG